MSTEKRMNCPICKSDDLVYYRVDQDSAWECECVQCQASGALDCTNSWIWENVLTGDIIAMQDNTTDFRNAD